MKKINRYLIYLCLFPMVLITACSNSETSKVTYNETTASEGVSYESEQIWSPVLLVYEAGSDYAVDLTAELESIILAGLKQIKNKNSTGKYYPTNVLLQNEGKVIVTLMDGDDNFKDSVFSVPRLLLEVSNAEGQWTTEHESYGDIEKLNTETVRLFSEYWQKPDEAAVLEVLDALKSDEVLSSCFPEAGSRPESWKEVRGQIEIYYNTELDSSETGRQMIRVYGAESIDLNQEVFAVNIRKTGEITDRHPNINSFFESDGTEGEICICCRKTDDGEYFIKADPYAKGVIIPVP